MERLLSNGQIAELLALEAEGTTAPMRGKALRKASRLAFLWPIEAAELLRQNRSLTELQGIGPHISKLMEGWIEKAPEIQIGRAHV